ncbi:hypothetical protein H9P43_000884 [Blastocladiella emersonii ATCC 22665]|nr:hypothetical protein H9P43_000884 [Blastocladiella emersonii ATCC 22665]
MRVEWRDEPAPAVLFVGGAYFDQVLYVAEYPKEDDKLRALDVAKRPGGNSMNSAVVLSQLLDPTTAADGGRCGILTAVGGRSSDVQDVLVATARAHGISWYPVPHAAHFHPTAWILTSRATASRTIINHNTLPQLTAAEMLACIAAARPRVRWIHFEGRTNTGDLREAMAAVAEGKGKGKGKGDMTTSLELERPNREGLDALIALADVVFVSNEFARFHGRDGDVPVAQVEQVADPKGMEMADADADLVRRSVAWVARWMVPRMRAGATAFLTLGSHGAIAVHAGRAYHAPVRRGITPVDTIGAGDSFNAGAIAGLLRGLSVPDALRFAVTVAGVKVARDGFEGIGEAVKE